MSPITSDAPTNLSPSSPSSRNLIEFTSNPSLAPRACDSCRKRKIKCDRKSNFCNQCFKNGTRCTYQDPIRKRGRPTKAKINSLKSLLTTTTTSVTQSSSDELESSVNQLPTPKTTANDTFLWDYIKNDTFTLPALNLPPIAKTYNADSNTRHFSEEMPAYDLLKYSTKFQTLPDTCRDPRDFFKQLASPSNTHHGVNSNWY